MADNVLFVGAELISKLDKSCLHKGHVWTISKDCFRGIRDTDLPQHGNWTGSSIISNVIGHVNELSIPSIFNKFIKERFFDFRIFFFIY